MLDQQECELTPLQQVILMRPAHLYIPEVGSCETGKVSELKRNDLVHDLSRLTGPHVASGLTGSD